MQLRIRVEKTILITKLFLAACSSSHLVTGYSLFLNPIYKKKNHIYIAKLDKFQHGPSKHYHQNQKSNTSLMSPTQNCK